MNDLDTSPLPERLIAIAIKMENQYGKQPDATTIREAHAELVALREKNTPKSKTKPKKD